jgi:DNA-binding SARP family transcriptional activator/DNA-binding XRE family transcriptional regulator
MTSRRSPDRIIPIGPLIRQRRNAVGLTQRQLAEAAAVSISALRDLEQGRTVFPRWGMVEGLTVALGIDQRQRADLLRTWRAGAAAGHREAPGHEHGPECSLPDVCINVLGPLVATRYGVPVGLGSARQQTVLGLLVLHQDSWLHRDEVIEVLWGEKPPPSAVAEVQGYISRLRRLLDSAHRSGERTGLIASAGSSYLLRSEQARIDLVAFERTVQRADEAVTGGVPDLGCQVYEQALGLWRGDVLADIDLLRLHPAVTTLACTRTEAVVHYAEAAAAAQAHTRALPHLRALCARERFNERAHAHLMIALAADGQQAAALQVFADLRGRLDRELGIHPSAALVRAHVRVLRQQLTAVSAPTLPRPT